MFIDYTATRQLVGSGSDEIETSAASINRRMDPQVSESVSMSGAGRESQLDRIDNIWIVTTVPEHINTLPRWREFAASVANGESFTFDAAGTQASPDDPISVQMRPGSYKENRLTGPYVQYSFEVLEL